ncbi:hypothetical protein DPMN_104913 [Dreissena polymorpha]|uniref:Uncharacterized protein n=1 Tax=Dreissena polymorpha TaxID=45954 RepID=A0A9D4HCV8_DREPO|nr:hypothetical protein DPMN_104913 [Dreissena polymorpha]
MEEHKVSEEVMKVNRYLALAGYQEDGSLKDVCKWKDHLQVADGYFQHDHRPGTVKSNILSVVNFLRWAKDERILEAGIADEVNTYAYITTWTINMQSFCSPNP